MKRIICFLSLLTLLAACRSTYITSSWKSEKAEPHTFKRLLVIGIIPDSSRALRQNMEKALTEDLKQRGINAISAFEEYGPKTFNKMDEEQANAQIRKKGFDGVITITLINKRKEQSYVPANVYTTYGYNFPLFWGYYSLQYERVYQPGYYDVDTHYFWESNLYDLNNGKLLYSVQSNAFNVYDAVGYSNDYARVIMKDLVKNKVIAE